MCFEPDLSIKFEPEGVFYKVFNIFDGKIYGEFFNIDGNQNRFDLYRDDLIKLNPYPVNTWVSAIKANALALNGKQYTCGFHGFISLEGAIDWGCNKHQEIFKCRYRGARLAGTIYRADVSAEENIVIVADEMMILGEVKDEDNIY